MSPMRLHSHMNTIVCRPLVVKAQTIFECGTPCQLPWASASDGFGVRLGFHRKNWPPAQPFTGTTWEALNAGNGT